MNKKLIETGKTYKFTDFIKIPFSVCPAATTAKIANKIIAALIPSIQLLVTASFIDSALSIFNGTSSQESIYLPLILLMVIVAYTYLNWGLMSWVDLKFDMCLAMKYRSAVIEKRAKLDYRHIENNDMWDLITRTCENPVEKITNGFNQLLGAAEIVIRVISLLVILMAQVWWAGLAVILICVPLFFLAVKGGKESYKANKEAQKHTRRAKYLQEVLISRENVEERAMFGYTDCVNEKWHDKYEKARKINFKVDAKYFIRMKGSSILTVVLSMIIIAVLLFPLKNLQITIGMFMALVTSTLGLVQMMSWQLSWTMQELAKNREYLKDLTAFCALSETAGATDVPSPSNSIVFESIEFKGVTFRYPDTDQDILKNFTLKINKNMQYAFVGINGAGKTTITKLLTGMYDNFEGEILINGKSIRSYTQAELKSLFSVVYQDFAKYYIPLKENVALGDVLCHDNANIEKAINVMELDEVVSKLPDGLDTWLGKIKEDGVDLSGGEWQRVAIARAIYNPAQVQILDEPTAALDPVAESNIYELFGKISVGKSTIFITHRLGAAKLADEIIVVSDGCVKEKGNHEKLLSLNGIYAEMFEAQRSWYQ